MRSTVAGSDDVAASTALIDRPELELLTSAFQSLDGTRTGMRYAASSLRALVRLLPSLVRDRVALRDFLALPTPLTLVAGTAQTLAAAERHYGGRRFLMRRNVAVSVLELPPESAAYLRGRSMQAVRTNRARGQSEGLTVQLVAPARADAAMDFLRRTGMSDETFEHARRAAAEGEGVFWTISTSSGEDFGVAHVTVEGTFALLNSCLVQRSGDQSAARYLFNSEIFLTLADQGVRYVLTGSALFLGPGLVYFQQRLGFDLRRVEIVDGCRSPEPDSPPH